MWMIKFSKNLLLSINVAKSDKIGIINGGGDCKNKIVEKSPSKNFNKAVRYFTLRTRLVFT